MRELLVEIPVFLECKEFLRIRCKITKSKLKEGYGEGQASNQQPKELITPNPL